jgi:protocatechuate 3,4-dioxygenase beta subunit
MEVPMTTFQPWSPSRRTLSGLVLTLPWWRTLQGREVQRNASGEPTMVAPPGDPSEALRARVNELEQALVAKKTTTNELLLDPTNADLRPYPVFRGLIEKYAQSSKAELAPKGEPGTPLVTTLVVVDKDGQPYVGVRVYAYQTSAKGWYAAEAPHVSGNSGDSRHARLFGCARTDAKGRCELVGVRPAPYPNSDLPSHIHVYLTGKAKDLRITEVRFEDCTMMTPEEKVDSLRVGYAVVPVTLGKYGIARCEAKFTLPAG